MVSRAEKWAVRMQVAHRDLRDMDSRIVAREVLPAKMLEAHARLTRLVTLDSALRKAEDRLQQACQLADEDEDMRLLAEEEQVKEQEQIASLEKEVTQLLVPPDPLDERGVIMEIRAGTGGSEAGLFAADMLRMYMRWCEIRRWQVQTTHLGETEIGGVRHAEIVIDKRGAYGMLRTEGGVHRVQRVPQTEASGRLHTSTCSVAVLPLATHQEEVAIDSRDLRIDTFRASGAGGQHVNKTDSAVRVTHLPSGLVAECQSERSQRQNREAALKVLASRLATLERERQATSRNADRRDMIGQAQRAEKIRTYNFPQSRVTDHRMGFTTHNLEQIMRGETTELLEAARNWRSEQDLQQAFSEDAQHSETGETADSSRHARND